MALGAQIRRERLAAKLTLAQLSERSGVDVGTISALESRDSERSKYASALAAALGTTVEALAYGTLDTTATAPTHGDSPATAGLTTATDLPTAPGHHTPDAVSRVDNGHVLIAQFDVGGGMGNGRLVLEAASPGVIKSWRVDREWLRANVPVYTSIENLCIVTGFGPSMQPMYNPGDPLLMDRGIHAIEHEGVYFFRVGDEGYIKIIQRVPDFEGTGYKLRVISKNPDYPPYDLSPTNPHLHVIGRILTAWKSQQF